jgi:hypothetical protein
MDTAFCHVLSGLLALDLMGADLLEFGISGNAVVWIMRVSKFALNYKDEQAMVFWFADFTTNSIRELDALSDFVEGGEITGLFFDDVFGILQIMLDNGTMYLLDLAA